MHTHKLAHTGIVTCTCNICGKGFTHIEAMSQHRRLVHKIAGLQAKLSKRELGRVATGLPVDR